MPTIIDSLIVELKLDASQFTKEQRAALDAARRLEAEQLKSAKNTEYAAGKASDAFKELRTSAITAFAAVTGSKSVADFAVNAVQAGAAAGRLSRNLNIPVNVISRWQGLAKIFGGSPEGMAESFTRMTDVMEGWKRGKVDPIITMYRALGAEGGTVIDVTKGVNQAFLDIAKNMKAIEERSPGGAGFWARQLGIDPGLLDAMISKQHDFNELLRQMNGLTTEQAENAGKLERRWLSFTESATRGMQSFVLGMYESDSKWNPFGANSGNAKDIEAIKRLWNWANGGSGPTSGSVNAAGRASAGVSVGGGSGAFGSQAEKEAFIRSEAAKRGINPNVAMAVAKSEGFNSFVSTIPGETSYSAYQLHVTPGGRGGHLGDQFKARTGLDPADRANEREAIRFALDDVTRNGWKAFHGAKNTGISQWQGVRDGSVAAGDTNKTEVNIGTVIVQPKTDNPQGWAGEFGNAVKNRAFASQGNIGQN